MIKLTLVILGKNIDEKEDKDIEFIYSDGDILNNIKKAKGKYITFIKEEDTISEDYLKIIYEKCQKDFDCCFINYDIKYDYKNKIKILTNENELIKNKPYYGEFIWNYIFKKSKLETLLNISTQVKFNKKVDEEFKKIEAIGKLIYFHNPKGKRMLKNFQFQDIKRNEFYKNVIYIGNGCNGLFNGYISWINNIGRCFKNNYDLVFLYDEINTKTLNTFLKSYKCIKRNNNVNYVCDRLITTYSDYFYPKNLFTIESNYLFIHGNMSDYENVRRYYDDIYTKYIAVSKIAAKKAKGYFPTKKIEYVINPFKLDNDLIKPHLRLTSAFRYCDVKRPERVELMAKLMTEMDIPYTWELFTDQKENTNIDGLIYRKRIDNPIPYVKDSDYFVLLSDSEAMPYCILEALAVNTKVVVTPLEAYDELGIINKDNGFIIPFEYFDEKNYTKLKEVIMQMYEQKDKKVKNKIDESMWEGYKEIFKK